jgi:hypothetical protein
MYSEIGFYLKGEGDPLLGIFAPDVLPGVDDADLRE